MNGGNEGSEEGREGGRKEGSEEDQKEERAQKVEDTDKLCRPFFERCIKSDQGNCQLAVVFLDTFV